MPARVEITDVEINARLEVLASRVSDLTPLLDQYGQYLLEQIRGYFDRETGPDGQPWAPLSPSWKTRKIREGKDLGIGRYTLSMFNGLAYSADSKRLTVGTTAEHAPAFQFGVPSQNQPARPFLGVTDTDRDKLSELIADHLAD